MTLDPVFWTWKVMVPAEAVALEMPHSLSVALTAIGPPALEDAVDEPVAPPDDVQAASASRLAAPATAVRVRASDMRLPRVS